MVDDRHDGATAHTRRRRRLQLLPLIRNLISRLAPVWCPPVCRPTAGRSPAEVPVGDPSCHSPSLIQQNSSRYPPEDAATGRASAVRPPPLKSRGRHLNIEKLTLSSTHRIVVDATRHMKSAVWDTPLLPRAMRTTFFYIIRNNTKPAAFTFSTAEVVVANSMAVSRNLCFLFMPMSGYFLSLS